MASTVVGMFDRIIGAEDAIQQLENAGIPRNDISLVAQAECAQAVVETSLVAGAGAGAAIGGVAGLLLGLVGFAIPGIGPILAAGPIAAAFTAGGIGAAAGGIFGVLKRMNIPENDAHYYADAVRRGCALLLVKARNRAEAERARQVLNRTAVVEDSPVSDDADYVAGSHSGLQAVHLRRGSGPEMPQGPLSGARVYNVDGREAGLAQGSFEHIETAWKSGFAASFQHLGYRYEQFRPAYRYGHALCDGGRHEGRAWIEIESEVRTDWENRNPHTWEQVKEAIRYAWENARTRNRVNR